MAVPAPTFAGWYPDPSDPVRLRHWNGRTWDPRLRTVPAWAVGSRDYVLVESSRRRGDPMLEGPVHAASLPAIATATAQLSRPAPRPGSPSRPTGSRSGAGAGPPTSGWAIGARPVRSSSWSRPRLALMVVTSLIGLVVLVLAATVGFTPRTPGTTTLAQDTTFIRSANIACGEGMAATRLPNASGIPSVAAVATANSNLAHLAARIEALPVVASGRSSIQGWLNAWEQYGADRQKEAASGSAANGPGSWASTVSLEADTADAFATADDLGNCTLTAGSSTLTAP
jgi:hypothetical protein